jgi:hypothetical protein
MLTRRETTWLPAGSRAGGNLLLVGPSRGLARRLLEPAVQPGGEWRLGERVGYANWTAVRQLAPGEPLPPRVGFA